MAVVTIPAGSLCFTAIGGADTNRPLVCLDPSGALISGVGSILSGPCDVQADGRFSVRADETTFSHGYPTTSVGGIVFHAPQDQFGTRSNRVNTTYSTIGNETDLSLNGIYGWTTATGAQTAFANTTGIVPDTSDIGPFVVTLDGVTCYYGDLVTSPHVVKSIAMSGVAGPNLVTEAEELCEPVSAPMLALVDGTVLIAWVNTATGELLVRHYDSGGSTLDTYQIRATWTGAFNANKRMCLAWEAGDANFWAVSTATTGITDSVVQQIEIATGNVVGGFTLNAATQAAILATIGVSGVWNPYQGMFVAPADFDASEWQGSIAPPTPGSTRPIRLLRQFGHFDNTAQFQTFISNLQIVCQTGVGLSVGQGSDPQLLLSFSKDGGHRWSNEVSLSLGKIGEYTARARLTRVGRSRDWAWRIVCTEPVVVALMSMVGNVEEGTS